MLRVNSPGGSYVASDSIWREVVRARNAGKPVVVSMSDVAASGGYFISMAADAIVAQPGTVTGSIGVFSGKPVVSDMLGKAGVTTDSVVLGQHAAMFSTSKPFSADEWQIVDAWLDHIYADFTGKVAAGRGLSAERVHELARGRVWTGADAHERKLVDELGGVKMRRTSRAAAPGCRRPRRSCTTRGWARSTGCARPQQRGSARGRGLGLRPARHRSAGGRSAGGRRAGATAPAGRTGVLGAGPLAESYGPVAQLAARLGLPAGGPLLLPGQLDDQLTYLRSRGARRLRRSGGFRGVAPRASGARPAAQQGVPGAHRLAGRAACGARGIPGSPPGLAQCERLTRRDTETTSARRSRGGPPAWRSSPIRDGRDDVGTTVSAFCPVSEDPPLVAVSLMSGSYLSRGDRQARTRSQ